MKRILAGRALAPHSVSHALCFPLMMAFPEFDDLFTWAELFESRLLNANLRLKVNRSFHLACLKWF